VTINSETQAIEMLNDKQQSAALREAAVRYLGASATPEAIKRLVLALEDNDFGVRWEAAVALTGLGRAALPELLKALADPERVADPRLREGAYHVLHYNRDLPLRANAAQLMDVLKGPAADISALEEAYRLLKQIEQPRRAKTDKTAANQRP
jgi:HEAT repeat protein